MPSAPSIPSTRAISLPEPLGEDAYQRRFDRLAETWRQAAQRCQDMGLNFVWEYEPGFWLNKPSEVRALLDAIDHPNFRVMFDTSHSYMGAVVGSRHTGEKDILTGGIVEYAELLRDKIGALHVIDSDGTLHDDETSAHTPFGAGTTRRDTFHAREVHRRISPGHRRAREHSGPPAFFLMLANTPRSMTTLRSVAATFARTDSPQEDQAPTWVISTITRTRVEVWCAITNSTADTN